MDLARLENPSLLPDLLSPTPPTSIWKWLAVILTAAFAARSVGLLFSKLQISISRRRSRILVRLPSFSPSPDFSDDASDCSDDTDDDADEIGERGREDEEEDESGGLGLGKVSGMGNFSFSSFALSDLVGGIGVVKSWDGLGFGFERTGSAGAGRMIGVDFASPAEIVSAASDAGGGAVVRVWDVRAGDETPAATARPLLKRRIAGVKALERKVFLRDDGGEIAVLDLRNLAQV